MTISKVVFSAVITSQIAITTTLLFKIIIQTQGYIKKHIPAAQSILKMRWGVRVRRHPGVVR